ncbi:kinesin-like protein KIF6 [Andrena cerasifolii]|uniref:kinesin-like protein KIF6 n=1 Tax=Andrena cerasifolii TaxID=2819439 RepID=UPI004037E6B4
MARNAIKVYARLKPEKNRRNVLNYEVHHRPKEHLEEDFLRLLTPAQKTKEYPDNRAESWSFSFFQIFEESTRQEDVFEDVARPVVESALDGYNGTIFAYGQTASGKTYTITGDQRSYDDRGIISRCLQYLFDVIRKRPENVYSVEVAYLEIYNENGYDLLDRRAAVTRLEDLPRVNVQEDEAGQLHLKNLTFHCVSSADEAMEMLLLGDDNRITAETPMNPQSSRSHCVFTIVVSIKQFGAERYKRAKVHLVDLAGSERVHKCSITGTILTEAKHINLSLHYLEQVIVCLGQESGGHVPYRNSLLTSILRDSLGGNCLTTMLANLSVTTLNVNETVSTCRFAQRVALVRNEAKVVLEKDTRSENALLRLENERLKEQIKEMAKQMSSEDLTAEDKGNLDSQIESFLESNTEIRWDHNPKKMQYCFESFKRIFQLNRDPNSCLKKVEYYKNMVVQRDKEISLLTNLVRKERGSLEHRVKEGSTEVSIENNSELIGKLSGLKRNAENVSAEDNAPSVANIVDEKEISIVSHVPPRKQKPRLKASKSTFHDHVDDKSQDINSQHQEKDNRDKKNYSQRNTLEEFSTNKSIPTGISKPDLLPCNVVNLTLGNATQNNDKATDQDLNQQSFRKIERNQAKCGEIQSSTKKNISTRHNSGAKVKPETDKVPTVAPQTIETKCEEMKTALELPFEETDYSAPVYQRFLNFNVPGKLSKPREKSIKASLQRVEVSSRANCNDFDDNSSREENIEPLGTKNICSSRKSINNPSSDEIESSRSKKIEGKRSATSVTSKACTPRKKSELDEADFKDSLPLTGDAEIDEEIIAFYRAKRSGGIY